MQSNVNCELDVMFWKLQGTVYFSCRMTVVLCSLTGLLILDIRAFNRV